MKRITGMPRWFAYQNWYTVPEQKKRNELEVLSIILAIMLVLTAVTVLTLIYLVLTDKPVKPAFTHHDTLNAFFKANGSPVPAVMANAVQQTKRPTLMAAISVAESNGTPWATGDSGKSKGAFQVQAKHWGKVPIDAVAQALQAEKILDELLRSKVRLRKAIIAYNGAGPAARAYERRVARLERSLR